MPTILWIVGEPGLGKTTAARQFVEKESYLVEAPKWTCGPFVALAGHYRNHTFDGADRVPYNGVQDCLHFWEARLSNHALTIYDGDRFSNQNVRTWYSTNYPAVRQRCVLFAAPPEIGQQRRTARNTDQNQSWVKGRITKSRRFFETFEEGDRVEICAQQNPDAVLGAIRSWLDA